MERLHLPYKPLGAMETGQSEFSCVFWELSDFSCGFWNFHEQKIYENYDILKG